MIPRTPTSRAALLGAGLAAAGVFLGLYLPAAFAHARLLNPDPSRSNQGAYVGYAIRMHESGYSAAGDRNRMPVYPFLQSLFYRPGMEPAEFFEVGKRNNIVLSLILLALLFAIFSAHLRPLLRVNLFLITAFDVFLFKAGYFQCELLYYSLSFCAFLLMARMLVAPAWGWGVLGGVTLGLSHLTKASAPPALALFVISGLAGAALAARGRRRGPGPTGGAPRDGASPASLLAGLAVVAASFLVTVYPYIATSKRMFGSYFYNVNSTYYMWYDSWDEAKAGTRAHGDRVGPVTLPPDQVPGPSRYFREHGLLDAGGRLLRGTVKVVRGAARSYGYFKYVVLYGAMALYVAWRRRPASLEPIRRRPLAAAFFASYVALYFLLYAWYAPIAAGNRLALMLFLPFMFCLSRYLQANGEVRLALGPWRPRLDSAFGGAVSSLVALDVVLALTGRIVRMYGGS